MKRFHSDGNGFTLVELLVVIAVLGVLAAVAVPLVIGVVEQGRDEAAASELRAVQSAVHAAMAYVRTGELNPWIEGHPPGWGSPYPPFPIPHNYIAFSFRRFGERGGFDVSLLLEPPDHDGPEIMIGDHFVIGGDEAVEGTYKLSRCGTVVIYRFPGLTTTELPRPRYPCDARVPTP